MAWKADQDSMSPASTNMFHASRRWALLLLPLFSVSRPAAAHSELRRSVPTAGAVLMHAPEQMELHFNERVQLTALRLYREGSEEISLPRRAIRTATTEIIALPPLPPGAYRAEWRIISADGHPAGGVISFRIEAPQRP
jgi:methionine-rich copper-binding protein CopC